MKIKLYCSSQIWLQKFETKSFLLSFHSILINLIILRGRTGFYYGINVYKIDNWFLLPYFNLHTRCFFIRINFIYKNN